MGFLDDDKSEEERKQCNDEVRHCNNDTDKK